MNILGIVFALAAGVFFGIIGPVTKTAYNLGAGVGLAIFLRYIVDLLIVPCLLNVSNIIDSFQCDGIFDIYKFVFDLFLFSERV